MCYVEGHHDGATVEMITPASIRWSYVEGRNGCEWMFSQKALPAVEECVVVWKFCVMVYGWGGRSGASGCVSWVCEFGVF